MHNRIISIFVLLSIVAVSGCIGQVSGTQEPQFIERDSFVYVCQDGTFEDAPEKCPGIVDERHIPETNKTWHSILKLNGAGDKNTEAFDITSNEWRFEWQCAPENEYTYNTEWMAIELYRKEADSSMESWHGLSCSSGPDTIYVYKGPGEFYFKINTWSVGPWSIEVEDYY